MIRELAALARAQATSAARRAVAPVAFALAAGLLAFFVLVGLFGALFFWLEPAHGPIAASLVVAVVAFVLALLALLPLMLGRRSPPPPPQDALPQFMSLMAQAAPNLGRKPLLATAALVAIAVIVGSRSPKN
jgi:hypothetical protein